MAACNMREQCAMRRGDGRRRKCVAAPFGRRETAGEQSDRSRFNVALTAGDLAGEAPARIRRQPQARIEQFWRIEKSIAMETAEPGKFGVLQTRDGAENAHLFAVLQLGLKADHVEQGS